MLSKVTSMLTSLVVLLTLLTIGTTTLTSPSTGTLTGRVTDHATGEPILGASVMVVGTALGAKTDHNGEYTIKNVPIGTYTVKITYIGYQSIEAASVHVGADETTELRSSMKKGDAIDTGKSVTVKGTKDIIDKFATNNEKAVAAETIKKQSTTTVDQLLEQVAGVKNGKVVNVSPSRAPETNPQPADALQRNERDKRAAQSYVYEPPSYYHYPPDAMYFKHYGENAFINTDEDNQSTFAADVDDASFSITKGYLENGEMPPDAAVRVEEFINHFDYRYKNNGAKPFGVHLEAAPSRFGNGFLLRVGIAGQTIPEQKRKPANLVFVIDVSGSMEWGGRLEMVKDALRYLVNELTTEDVVGIVTYNDVARTRLEPTSVANRRRILQAIDQLRPGGSTNAAAGIRMGYQMADEQFQSGYTNRVILCSDGVANVGVTDADGILASVKPYIKKGITMTSVGIGMGNYNDVLLEQLGDKANGHYAYINTLDDARKIFVENLTGTLQVIARDVKIQLEFNPAVVSSYRLLGYENRDVADEDFRNNKVDGGEIGSGHTVTALYEIKLYSRRAKDAELGQLAIRYKHPETKQVVEISEPIDESIIHSRFKQSSDMFKLAAYAAEFSEILRGSYWARGSSLDNLHADVLALASRTEDPQIEELATMIEMADRVNSALAER